MPEQEDRFFYINAFSGYVLSQLPDSYRELIKEYLVSSLLVYEAEYDGVAPDPRNVMAILPELRKHDEFQDLFDDRSEAETLALAISMTEKSDKNWPALVIASQRLAALLLVESTTISEKYQIRELPPEARKREGRKKGGRASVEVRQAKANERDRKIKAWALECVEEHGWHHLAAKIIGQFDIKERKARTLISELKNAHKHMQ